MSVFKRLYEWLDFRPEEAKLLWLSFSGAFLVVGFMILARSLREALFLDAFPVKNLPYMTFTVVALSFPTAAAFSHFLARHQAQGILKNVSLLALAGIGVLWPVAHLHFVTILLFYLWTSLCAIVLTAGFWIVVAEHFPVRGAKRLYGLISAGGTAGALVTGTALRPLTKVLPVWQLLPLLIGLLGLLWVVLILMPKPAKTKVSSGSGRVSLREQVQLVKQSPHLWIIAVIVVSATLASTLLDFQFKEFVKLRLQDKATMAGFFGAFYGWTGGISLLIQIFITSRLMSKFGIGVTLSVLPLILIGGAATLLFILTSFTLVTVTRGADNALRKSLHRSALEVLYVPVPSLLRRKTKTFVDSVLDSAAEGVGAVLIFLTVTLFDLPSRYLSAFVLFSAFLFLYQVRRMGAQYYKTLEERLKEEADFSDAEEAPVYGQDLLNASFSSLDLQGTLKKRGIVFEARLPRDSVRAQDSPIRSGDSKQIQEVIQNDGALDSEDVPTLLRLLVRDPASPEIGLILSHMGNTALKPLVEALLNEEVDFVIRRRIPRILAKIPSAQAEQALLKALTLARFEIRYRSAIALMRRRQAGCQSLPPEEREPLLWDAIRFEVNHERAVWEMQKILDQLDEEERDDFLEESLEAHGSISLEHVFRILALIIDPKLVKAAHQALKASDKKLKSFALEYLEHVLPDDIREKLWPFIGDVSEKKMEREIRPLDVVAQELLESHTSLIVDKKTKDKLIEAVKTVEKNEEKA